MKYFIIIMFTDTAIVINRADMGDFGTMFKIVPYTTQTITNQMTCFKVPGQNTSKVVAQGVLPDTSLYTVSQVLSCRLNVLWYGYKILCQFVCSGA